jgi:hypothetical protein
LKFIRNIFLSILARALLYILGAPLLVISTASGLLGGYGPEYYRLIAIVLDILGCVLGGPVWNIIFFKKGAKPEVKFGSVTTMSFVFAFNYENFNDLGRAIYNAVEWKDPGHMERAKFPTFLQKYILYWTPTKTILN